MMDPLSRTDDSVIAPMVYMRLTHIWNPANENTRWKLVISSERQSAKRVEGTNTPAEKDDAMSKNLNCPKKHAKQ